GFSPGAALVFLLAGPATNVMTIAAAAQSLGRGGAVVYVLTIALVSLGMGALLDLSFDALGLTPSAAVAHLHEHTGWLQWTCAAIIASLVVWHLVRRLRKTA